MRKHKLLSFLLTLVMAVSVALVGCSKTPSTTDKPAAAGPDADQYLNVAFIADVRSLDSAKVTDLYSATALLQTNEGFIRVSNDGEKDSNVKAGAEDWTVSADGTVYTFKLRDSKWSDGQPVTAKDYEYAWKRAINPLTKSGYSYLIYPLIKGASEVASTEETDPAKIQEMLKNVAIVAKDDKTLEVTLNSPCPYFEKLLGMQTLLPQRQDKVEAAGETYGQDPTQLVYNGPFVIQEWTKGSKLVLKKNENYWDAANVKLETVTIPIIKDENARMKAFETNETDAVGASGDFKTKYEAAAKAGTYQQISGFEPATNYIFFNAKDKNKIFTNRDIRMAFSLALNREEYCESVIKFGVPAYGWAPYKLLNGTDEFRKSVPEPLKEVKDDPKTLLLKGMKELGLGEDPSKITVTFLNSGTTARDKTIGEYLQNTWQTNLGVVVKLDAVVDFPQFLDRIDAEDFQISSMAWSGDYNDPMTFFDMWTIANTAPGGNNSAKWESKEYDALVAQAMVEPDAAKRLDLYAKMEKMLVVDAAAIAPTQFRDKNTFMYPYVKNLGLPLFGPIFDFKTAYTEGRTAK